MGNEPRPSYPERPSKGGRPMTPTKYIIRRRLRIVELRGTLNYVDEIRRNIQGRPSTPLRHWEGDGKGGIGGSISEGRRVIWFQEVGETARS
jgi:hypothetical protein